MKPKALAALAALAALCGHGKTLDLSTATPADIRACADARIAAIRATPNTPVPEAAPRRYLSAKGSDAADGLTPATAWRSIARLNAEKLAPGSFVLFERGGVYRGSVQTQPRVTYTAYGEGPKPCVFGSPENGADPAKWARTENPNVWAYAIGHDDVGTLVFDDGAAHAIKIVIRTDRATKKTYNKYTGRPFAGYRDLDGDLHFWHDYYRDGTGKVYLYSAENPGLRFKSIEFNVKCCGFRVGGNAGVTIDNFTVKYVGVHGVSAGTCRELAVRNCEFGWIGGSIQGEAIFGRDHPTRLGNAVEVYGGCDVYSVANCYIWQVYDAGVTHQFNIPEDAGAKRYDERNVVYRDNVFEKCNYSIEYFLTSPKGNASLMENLLFEGNLAFDAGVGFCEQRPDRDTAAHIKAWRHPERNRAKNYVIRNNAFCGSKEMLLQICSGLKNLDGSTSMPRMEGNVIVGRAGDDFGCISETSGETLKYGPGTQAYVDAFGPGNRCIVTAAGLTIENARMKLVVGADATVRSLTVRATGEDCLSAAEPTALFAVTQDRPFNNEIKLIEPTVRTVWRADALRREGERLIVGFPHRQYEAVVRLRVTPDYAAFELEGFRCDRKSTYDYLKMDIPPVASFRVLQLPVKNRRNFGKWLNASWDEGAAVAVVGTSPFADIGHEERTGCRILTADLVRGRKLTGASAALIVGRGREDFLDCMDRLERDFDLPRGVESRRSEAVGEFIYHVSGRVSPQNLDRHIFWARRGGFRCMTFDAHNFTKSTGSWGLNGDYDWNDDCPNGTEGLKAFLARVKAAGIRPGLHFLHTHIGMKSRYVTPVADPRLNKTRRFTLAKPLTDATNETEIAVFEPTEDAPLFGPCRVLQFGGELVSYESFTREPPYRFLGVRRGAWKTRVVAHPRGEVGGILDISEFGSPMSCYLDQDTDLQDEVAGKIAALYNCGFEYAYFDGSEGVNRPFGFHVSNAQYRQWKAFSPKPLFSEGAAKSHFGWHILSGANAFDCFGPDVFKRKIVEFPVAQAPKAAQDMTRVNFGWWRYFPGRTRPDHWQFACSQCLAWDCPATVLVDADAADADRQNAEACFEVMRLWNEARRRHLLTDGQKKMLRNASVEYHLSLDGETVRLIPQTAAAGR